jgi:endopolyphosphatase
LHPDPHYKLHSSTDEGHACHHGKGSAGTYGAETSDCDSPFSLVDATFKWIAENLKDEIDFVVWTGDSARHDSDESIPRTEKEVLDTNRRVMEKVVEVFGNEKDPNKALKIPVIPTFGNNDILPHNILLSGPNKWLKKYSDIWRRIIPEEQRHGFERGGWFYVEAIPNKLAVFSLNTLYFFSHNAAVDGCAAPSEPGYEHMEWLRIQLQFMRERGMKAILTGHVPPARTESKELWDESCWQKYTLWLQQYRDVVVGGLYGHMNIDHFMLQDTEDVNIFALNGEPSANGVVRTMMDDELMIDSANDYLEELRDDWSGLPDPSVAIKDVDASKKKKKKNKKDKALKKMGGPWGERFQVTYVSPSVVPNYFPTLRVFEYNITGLEETEVWSDTNSYSKSYREMERMDLESEMHTNWEDNEYEFVVSDHLKSVEKTGKKHKKKKPKKPHNPGLIIPPPPTKGSPPGPAYSPQTLTMLGYTQYFANLTHINNDFVKSKEFDESEEGTFEDDVDAEKWHPGKHKGKEPTDKAPKPKHFQYQVEYDTTNDQIYKLKDLTVRSFIKLAHRIGQYKQQKGNSLMELADETAEDVHEMLVEIESDLEEKEEDGGDDESEIASETKGDKKDRKKKKKDKKKKQKKLNKVWLNFISRAFVGTHNGMSTKARPMEHAQPDANGAQEL